MHQDNKKLNTLTLSGLIIGPILGSGVILLPAMLYNMIGNYKNDPRLPEDPAQEFLTDDQEARLREYYFDKNKKVLTRGNIYRNIAL